MMRRTAALGLAIIFCTPLAVRGEDTIRVACKNFTEQEILGELVAQLIERHTTLSVERRFGLGGTGICHSALVAGEVDLYIEYTGTALVNVLRRAPLSDHDAVFRAVAKTYREQFDSHWLPPIGLNNTYALAVRASAARRHHWSTVSDLRSRAPKLRAGFTGEFVERPDGYAGLRRAYDLTFGRVVDLDPGLMYKALANKEVDVICAFATDGRIEAYDLLILKDDRRFFPPYDACPVVRQETLAQHPEVQEALVALAGTIDDRTMRLMNRAVDELGRQPAEVAAAWIESRGSAPSEAHGFGGSALATGALSFWALCLNRRREILDKTLEHLALTFLAVALAVVVGVPLGILIHQHRSTSAVVLGATEVVQTIPSLAMLAFLFAVYGVLGILPAVTALVLYALLPVVLNTFTGLKEVPAQTIEAADGVGMSTMQKLGIVELPLALPVIIAGIRTAAVWSVGIATLSTFIGAGGLGDFISRGLARDDPKLTLLGGFPAGLIAIALSLGIRRLEQALRT